MYYHHLPADYLAIITLSFMMVPQVVMTVVQQGARETSSALKATKGFLQVCLRLTQHKLSYPMQELDNMDHIPRGTINTNRRIIYHSCKINRAHSQ